MLKKTSSFLPRLLFMLFILVVLIGIISDPSLSFKSANKGIGIWFNILLPSLLPFLIISEMLIRLGFVEFVGKLLSPIMIKIFNIPGEGAFPFTISMISGYPIGAKLTSSLREKNIISRIEGNRLICFTSTSGPSFMLAAVAVGMLNNRDIGYLILFPHYLSAICLGIIFRFYKKNKKTGKNKKMSEDIKALYRQTLNKKNPLGSLITGSIKGSMDTIFLIGGLVIFFSVAIEILFDMQFIDNTLSFFASILSLNKEFLKGIVSGIFEITMGCKIISTSNVSILLKLLGINFVIGWSGFSIHSQVIGFLNNTDLNKGMYIASKFFHGIISTIFTYIFYICLYSNSIVPSFSNASDPYNVFIYTNWFNIFLNSFKFTININIIILLFSLIIYSAYGIKGKLN